MFRQLESDFKYPAIEKEILETWEKEEIFKKSLEQNSENPYFTFYEGPPTVNGKPGIHHVMSRTVKDLICRYQTMKGKYVRRQAGWDTHGLPVEIQVEKELGLKDKSEVEEFGVKAFNEKCREFVFRNIDQNEGWKTLTVRMGYWVDMDAAYITCTPDYMESVWWALDQYFKKNLIYKGFRVVPQSPTIETPLSSHELSLGYKEVQDPNCYIKLKLTKSAISDLVGAELMVWTTTPWTLFSNVALAVGEDIEYCLVKNTRKLKGKEPEEFKLVLAKARLSVLDGEYEIIKEFKGSELIGSSYEQIFPYLDLKTSEHPNALTVLKGDFVTTSDGTGIVHLAPAFGEDDYQMSLKFDLPFVQPVTPNGHLTEELGEFAGRAIKTFTYDDRVEEGVDKDVVIALKHAGKIYKSANNYLHNYPHCWRTGNPIMYYARESWFIKSSGYKSELVENNKKINWQPKEIGTGRFGNWLDEVKDWNISRDRYWGTPLPLWVNTDNPEDVFSIGSFDELRTGYYDDGNLSGNFGELVDNGEIEKDLHRHIVDNITFTRYGSTYKRVNEVIDVWFDSGSMPFAQMHYPFENKELFEKSFPGDFIAEGIDQTRGWFYTLHNIGTALFDSPSFKSIIVNELILDKNGVKMSKRLGNTVDPFNAMEDLGADAIRWYMLVNNPPWKTSLFNVEEIRKTVISDFFRSLTNTYNFFALYANIDGISGEEDTVPISQRAEIDRWILSKMNSLINEFKTEMENLEVTKAHRSIQEFAVNDLSNWYIRRNRRRFWKGEKDHDKIAAYQTLKEVLDSLLKIIAPAAPFLSDYLFRSLNPNEKSIHLKLLPSDSNNLSDKDLERKMDTAQRIVFLARSLREKSNIKTRQPLSRILVPVKSPQDRRDIESVENIIKEEINIKSIEFLSEKTADIISRKAKPNFKLLGKIYGKSTNVVANLIKGFSSEEIEYIEQYGSKNYTLTDGTEVEITTEAFDTYSDDIEGWLVSTDKGVTVALDTTLTDTLIAEGTAREFVSYVQNERKAKGFEVTDRISILLTGDNVIIDTLISQGDYIKSETLAEHLNTEPINDDSSGANSVFEIEDKTVIVKIEKL
ncbi:MAG: isoleucine--tRNA ligase [Candidatus Kapaibacteriales bacterium]